MPPPRNTPTTELYGDALLAVVQRNAAATRAAQHRPTLRSPGHIPMSEGYMLDITQRPPNNTTRRRCTCLACAITTAPRPTARPAPRQARYTFPPETPHQTLLGFFRWAAHNEGFQGTTGRYKLFTAQQGLTERRATLEDAVGMAVIDWARVGVDGETAGRLRRLAAEYALAREGAWLRGI